MLDLINNINVIGWVCITIIAFLIFIVLMVRGIRLGWGDKSVAIGKQFDNKLATFKKDLEIINIKKTQDEVLQKKLFKKSIHLDNYLNASLIKSVKKLESDVYKIFKPYLICQYPALCIVDIFEDTLLERVHFNNIKKKLMTETRTQYLNSIVFDIEKKYLVFFEQLQLLHCGVEYPEWGKIKEDVINLVKKWFLECIDYYIVCVKKKINLYEKHDKKIILEEIHETAINFPLKKNKHYLNNLLKAKKEMKED